MIVKDESHIIRETLENLVSHVGIDYWVISDTGSTDNTSEIITEFFKEKNIPGELFHDTWKNFGHNRTLALEHAYQKSDYILIFDADDKIAGKMNLDKETLCMDSYSLKLKKGAIYYRPLLVTNRKRWKFVGIVHEFLTGIDPMNGSSNIEGDYFVDACTTGNRSNDEDKYKKDAENLSKAYDCETDKMLKHRYAFYAAQSYRDSLQTDKAIEWYKLVLTLDNWAQEKYYASLMLGHLYESKKDFESAIRFFTKTVEYDSERIEGVVNACRLCYDRGMHLLVHALYEKYKTVELSKINLSAKLFLSECCYQDEISYYNSISSYYLNNYASGYESCKRNILNQRLCKNRLYNAIDNMYYYRDEIQKDKDTKELFKQVTRMLSQKENGSNERDRIVLNLLERNE